MKSKKSRATQPKNLAHRSLSKGTAKRVKGGMRNAGGDPKSAGAP